MLGLSIGIDSGVPKMGRNNHKSYHFAESNIGRFHTSGVSGSMKKHTSKNKKKDNIGEIEKGDDDQAEKLRMLKERSKNYVPDRLEARQREIEEDTMKLLALEKKLDEVKRQKEMKRKREEGRQQQRLHYSAARTVQRAVRRWLLKRFMRATTILQVFLKFAAAKQAVAAANWAISTLRRFVQMIEVKQLKSIAQKEVARSTRIALEKKTAATLREARKQAALVASHSILMGAQTVALQKQHQNLQKQKRLAKKVITSPKAFGSPTSRASMMWALLRKRVVPVMFKFHDKAWRRRTYFTDGYLNPAKDMDHPNYRGPGPISIADVAVQVEERRKRSKMQEVMRLHKQREEAMAQERVLRLQMIHEEKRKKEEEQHRIQQIELMQRAQKEKSKVDFLRRVESEQSEKARIASQLREKKDKQRRELEAVLKQEVENEAVESKLMYAEDTRFHQNLEKVRRQRLKDYAAKKKLEQVKTERDLLPVPGQGAGAGAGAGHLSARGRTAGGGGAEDLTEEELAQEEERKMLVLAANEAALKQRLAARRAAEKQEKRNAEMEQEMIRKEQELVAMKAQLMMKRAAFMKAKAKKLKEQAEENSRLQQQDQQDQQGEGGVVMPGQGSSSARARSRGGSRGGSRKKTSGGRTGSGSAPSTARESPTKKRGDRQKDRDNIARGGADLTDAAVSGGTVYDVEDPLALVDLPPHRHVEGPGEDWDWHTPRAVGSGKSAISDLRRSKYSPIHKHLSAGTAAAAGGGGGGLVSPGAVRLNSAERLAMACRRGQDMDQEQQGNLAPHPLDKHSHYHQDDHDDNHDNHDSDVIVQNAPFRGSASVHDVLMSPRRGSKLPPSPVQLEQDERLKLPLLAAHHTASEGKLVNKPNKAAPKGLIKNKYIADKLGNSPYGSLLPKTNQHRQPQNQQHHNSAVADAGTGAAANGKHASYLTPQVVVAPTAAFTSFSRPACPSLQGVSLLAASVNVKKSVRGDSLMEIVEKAREKLKQDRDMHSGGDEMSAALAAATAALGGKPVVRTDNESGNVDTLTQTASNEQPKMKRKKKIKKKQAAPPPAAAEPAKPVVAPVRDKASKRKLINDTYNRIMKAELAKKEEEKRAVAVKVNKESSAHDDEEEVPPQVVADFFAQRRQESAAATAAAAARKESSQQGGPEGNSSLSYWSSVVGGGEQKDSGASSSKGMMSPKKSQKKLSAGAGAGDSPTRKSSSRQGDFQLAHLQETVHDHNEQEEERLHQHQHQHAYRDENDDHHEDEYCEEEEEEEDYYYDEDFEEHGQGQGQGQSQSQEGSGERNSEKRRLALELELELDKEFQESQSFGDAYEEELNRECERLRAELEAKMLAKFNM